VLTLDGYNDTAVYNANDSTPDVPLPVNVDRTLLNCLNETIGNNVPLVGAAGQVRWGSANLGLVLIVWWMVKVVSWI
jgi:hypothetical protein